MKFLRLWAVQHRTTGKFETLEATGETAYFNAKLAAKVVRDTLGPDWKVTKGPDHRLYRTPEEVKALAFTPKKGKK
jgi:hypothetical protein